MKRSWLRFLLPVIVLVIVGAGSAVFIGLSTMPSVTAGALSQALGRRVELGAIDVRPWLSLEVEVDDVRVYATAEPGAGELPLVEARRAVGRQPWLRLLIGQLVPLDWELDAPIVRVSLDGPQSTPPGFPLQALVAHDARIELKTGSFGMLELGSVELEARRRTLLPGVTGKLSTQVRGMGTTLGRIDASFDIVSDQISVSGTLGGLALSRIPRVIPYLKDVKLGGQAGGQIDVVLRRDRIRGSFDLDLKKASLELPRFEGQITPAVARASLGVEWRDNVWKVEAHPVKLDEVELTATATFDTNPGGRVRVELTGAPMVVGQATAGKFTAISFMGHRYESWRGFDHSLETGTFVDTRFTLDVDPKDFGSTLTYGRAPAKGELFLHTRLVGGLYRPKPDQAPLEDMTGVLELDGNSLVIRELKLRREEAQFPPINIVLDGFAHFITLPGEARRVFGGPGTDLPGIGPAFRALSKSDDAKPSESEFAVGFSDLAIAYPGFILPVHSARGRMRFPKGRFVVDETRAVIGGAPAALDVNWTFAPPNVEVGIRYLDDSVVPPHDFGSGWLAANIQVERVPLGDWTLADVQSRVEGKGGTLAFERVEADFEGGSFRADGSVDISKEGRAPLGFDLSFEGASAVAVTRGLGFENTRVEGTTQASGKLAGTLDPDASFLRTCDLTLGIEFRDGRLENVPAALQLARIPSLQGIRGLFGQPLPYRAITSKLELHQGKLQIEELSINSSDIRVLAAGDVDLNTPRKEADMLVGLLFLRTLDGVIGSVPLVGDLILGDDRSLLKVTFRMRGPVASPSFTPATPATLQGAADLTGSFLRRLKGLIPGLRPSGPPPEPETPSEPAPEAQEPGASLPDAASPPGDGPDEAGHN